MSNQFTFTLQSEDVSQILDALQIRKESWKTTHDCLIENMSDEVAAVIEDCTDAGEAQRIYSHYVDIIDKIESQLTLH